VRHSADGLSANRGPGAGGWVRLHRKLLDHPIWLHLAPAVAKVAIYFLLRANYKPGETYDGSVLFNVPPGSFVTSLEKTAMACNISKQQARDAFDHLSRTQFATYRRTRRWTLVTIVNWTFYQAAPGDEDTLENIEANTSETTIGTLNKKERSKDYPPHAAEGVGGCFPADLDDLPFAPNLDPQPDASNGKDHFAGAAVDANGSVRIMPEAVQYVAKRMYERHPKLRRDLGIEQVAKRLAAILKHQRIPSNREKSYLELIDRNHAAMCATEAWQKDGGQFAKGLENWLAPTKERYLAEPPPPPPQNSSRAIYSHWEPPTASGA
jgi:hypothetical protein